MQARELLDKLVNYDNLSRDEAMTLMESIMTGELTHAQVAAILTSLRMKGETVDEITGFVAVLRDKAITVRPKTGGLVDTCGTGGDGRHTFNISTATAIVAAGMGIPIAKHGNRAISSDCGSADVLEALGVNIDLDPDAVGELIDRVGIGFLFAPAHHPAMKYVAPVRKDLGVRTVFNLLGPLANPACVKRQLVGVFREGLTETVAHVLHALGSEKVFVVHGADGTDEVSIAGPTTVSLLEHGHVHTMIFTPEDAGLEPIDLPDLHGGTAEENAAALIGVLEGDPGPRRDAVVLNAAYVAVVADRAKNLTDGANLAKEAIDAGEAIAVLERLRETSNTLAGIRK